MALIRLRAGPFDGRSARHDDAFPLMLTGLLYLPGPARPELPPDERVPIQTCAYQHRSSGVYDFVKAKQSLARNDDYCGIKRIQDECNWLRALMTDPRLAGERGDPRSASSALLPLEQAQERKEAALPRYRRWLQEKEGAGDLPDEEVWGVFVYRTLGDMDWAAVGKADHLDSVRGVLMDFFDIDIPLGDP